MNEILKNWVEKERPQVQSEIFGEIFTIKKNNTYNFTEKILDNATNYNVLSDMLREDKQLILFIAPTNVGKTFSIFELFKGFKEEDSFKNVINVLAVPTTTLCNQTFKSYSVKFPELRLKKVIGNGKKFSDYDFHKTHNFVCTYDKLAELIGKDVKIRLVLDEAHNLITQQFRYTALSNINKITNQILSTSGCVIHMTATYQVLSTYKYDSIFNLEKFEKYEANADKIKLYINKTGKKYTEAVFDYLTNNNAIVRLNNKPSIKTLSENLKKEGKKVGIITREEQEDIYRDDNKDLRYKNETVDAIINDEKLNNVDIAFASCIMDCGSNIKKIEGRNTDEYKSVYCLDRTSDYDLMNIEQFFNRFRFKATEYVLIADLIEQSERKELIPIKFYIKNNKKVLEKNIEYMTLFLNALKLKYTDATTKEINKEELIEEFDTISGYKYNEVRNDLGMIYLTEDLTISYNVNAFFNKCYEDFSGQYANNLNLFISKLEKIFNKKIEVVDYIGENKEVEFDYKLVRNNAINTLCIALSDNKLLKQIEERNIDKDSILRSIKNTDVYKNLIELNNLTKDDIKITINQIIVSTDKEIEEIKLIAVKKILNSLNIQEKILLEMCAIDEQELGILVKEDLKDNIINISKSKYFNIIKNGLKNNMSIDDVIELINNDTEKEVNKEIDIKKYIDNNKKYIAHQYLGGRLGIVQKLILDFYMDGYDYKTNKTKRFKVKQDKTEQLVKDIAEILDEEFTFRKLCNLIDNIFKTNEITVKEKYETTTKKGKLGNRTKTVKVKELQGLRLS